ncbi:MAG: GC-type dockerin domain-anchored protein [Phycisphaerales bacterium]
MRRAAIYVSALVAMAMATAGSSATLADPCDSVRIPPPDVVPPIDFGGRLIIDGDFWFIGDVNARVLCPGYFGCTSGAMHVYEMVDGSLEHRQMIIPPTPRAGDFFSGAADLHEGRLIIGSLTEEWPGLTAKGGAFVYEYDGRNWVQTSDIRPPDGIDPTLSSRLGSFVAIEGNAAYLRPLSKRTVFAYQFDEGEWMFDGLIESPDGLPANAFFGQIVVPHGPWLFINAPQDSTAFDRGGSVYVFRRDAGGSIEFHQKLMPFDAPGGVSKNQFFGIDVAFDGETLAIGAPGAMRGGLEVGAVLTYELAGDEWTFVQELLPPTSDGGVNMGLPVVVDADTLLSGSQRTPTTSAAVHYFHRNARGEWAPVAKLIPDAPDIRTTARNSLATRGRWALVGAPDDLDPSGETTGAAYLFDLSCFDCPPDLDLDGALTIFDFLTYLNLFQDGDAQADFDGDGELTIFDFLAFQDALQAGC